MIKIEEIWKKVKNFEDLYEVSSFGRLRSLDRTVIDKNGKTRNYKGQVMSGRIKKGKNQGYIIFDLFKDNIRHTIRIHRIVAETFIPNPENKMEVNHKDGNKQNNHVDNLEWCNRSENIKHAYDNNLRTPNMGGCIERNKRVSIRVALCDRDFNIVKEFNSISELSDYINNNKSGISDCLRRNNGKAIYKGKYYIKYI